MSAFQYNIYTSEVYLVLASETSAFIMSVSEDLSAAQVQGTLISSDGYRLLYVDINLSLTGTSEIAVEPGAFVYNFHSKGEYRDAVATGTVTVNGVNLTPGPSTTSLIIYAK